MRGYTQDKDAYLKRLRRVEGQVRGLQRMVEQDDYCIDVLTQISAVTRALQAVALGLLEDHLGHCVTSAIEEGGPDAQAKVHEAAEAISRLVKSRGGRGDVRPGQVLRRPGRCPARSGSEAAGGHARPVHVAGPSWLVSSP